MKKFLYLLLALPMLAVMAACSNDDKDMPEVNLHVDYSGAVLTNNALTIAQGDTLTFNSVTVTPVEGTGNAEIGYVTYLIDGLPVFNTVLKPFSVEIATNALPVGNHRLTLYMQILQAKKSIAFGIAEYMLTITEPTSDTPTTGGGTDNPNVRITDHDPAISQTGAY